MMGLSNSAKAAKRGRRLSIIRPLDQPWLFGATDKILADA